MSIDIALEPPYVAMAADLRSAFGHASRWLTAQLMRAWRLRLAARRAAHQRAEFARLSPHELRDLGLDRSEYLSCELEADGRIEITRLRLWGPSPAGRGPNPYCY